MNMKRFYMRVAMLMSVAFLVTLTLASCKKKDLDDGDGFGTSGSFQMKLNGSAWKADMSLVSTGELVDGRATVVFGGQRTVNGDEEGESLMIIMALTADQFADPKGVYDIFTVDSDEDLDKRAVALFLKSEGPEEQSSYTVSNANDSYGRVTITGFKIGEGRQIGDDFYGKIYTELSGTFEMNMNKFVMGPEGVGYVGEQLRITDGKFKVNNLEGLN